MTKVSDWMTPNPITIDVNCPLFELLKQPICLSTKQTAGHGNDVFHLIDA